MTTTLQLITNIDTNDYVIQQQTEQKIQTTSENYRDCSYF